MSADASKPAASAHAGDASAASASDASAPPPRKVRLSRAWQDARILVRAHRRRLSLGLGLLLVNRLSGFVLPATSRPLLDEVVGNGRADLLLPLAIAGGIATLVQAGTGYMLSQVLGVAAQRAINDLRMDVAAHVARLPIRAFDATQTGAFITRIMTDAEGIRNLVGTGLVQLVGGIVTALIALVVLFVLDASLTLMILAALALFGFIMSKAFRKLRPLFRERGKITSEITGRLNQTLGGIRVVKAYAAESAEQSLFAQGVGRLFANVRATMTGVSLTGAAATAIVGALSVLLLVVGGRSMLDGSMTVGDFVMYLVFIGLIVGPMVEIASIGTQITEAFAGLDRIRETRSTPTEDADDASLAPCPDVRGDIVFEDVHFAYEADKPVLRGVSLHAPPGTTTSLVGSSGSGKSTLVGLVMAFHRPDAGRVLVDGRDLAGLRLGDYRRHLGVVLQETFLFDGTVAENIAFSRPDAPRAEVEDAGRVAHCDEFVRGFPDGYDTVVGERGIKLSGGQRQRVSIARALLARPRILILDEATSSLDSESEALLQDGLAALRHDRTTFVIAHRLSTIRSADQILVVEEGQIVERGRHAELYARGGRYRELHDRQHAFERERFLNPGEELPGEETGAAAPAAG